MVVGLLLGACHCSAGVGGAHALGRGCCRRLRGLWSGFGRAWVGVHGIRRCDGVGRESPREAGADAGDGRPQHVDEVLLGPPETRLVREALDFILEGGEKRTGVFNRFAATSNEERSGAAGGIEVRDGGRLWRRLRFGGVVAGGNEGEGADDAFGGFSAALAAEGSGESGIRFL